MRRGGGLRLGAALAMLACAAAHAGRPLQTDDARLLDAKACQLETWVRHNEGSREYWALPACNPTGNAELAFGGAKTREDGATGTSALQVQAKTLIRALEPNGWGIGAAVGYLDNKLSPNRGFAQNLYGYVPASVSFADDAFVLHANVGTVRPDGATAHRFTWGVASELQLHKSLFVVAEVFRQDHEGPHYQAGLRYWIVPNRVQADATIGDRLGESRGSRWYTIGLKLQSKPFLP